MHQLPLGTIGPLLALAAQLRNRPGFKKAVDLLRSLFVDVLGYESRDQNVMARLKVPPSTDLNNVVCVAESHGIRVLVLDHGNDVYHPSIYEAVFRYWHECLLFVVSRVSNKVRIILRLPSKAGYKYIKRALTPVWVYGPNSDTTATWAARLGLLSRQREKPSYVRYRELSEVLTVSTQKLMEQSDPYSWESRQEWMPFLNRTLWHEQQKNDLADFLAPNQAKTPSLHEALLRTFPAYLSDTSFWVNYHDFTLELKDDLYHIHIRLGIYCRSISITVPTKTAEIVLTFPRQHETGFLVLRDKEWIFVPRMKTAETSEIDRDEDRSIELEEEPEPELHENEWSDKSISEEPWNDDAMEKDSLGEQLSSWTTLEHFRTQEPEGGEQATTTSSFLLLSQALCHGASGRLMYLHRLLRKCVTTLGTLDNDVHEVIRQWGRTASQIDQDHEAARMLRRFFVEDYFEQISPNAPPLSPLGYQLKVQAVVSNGATQTHWSCPYTSPTKDGRYVPLMEAVCHPHRMIFITPKIPSQTSSALAKAAGILSLQEPTFSRARLRNMTLEHQFPIPRVALLSGETPSFVGSYEWSRNLKPFRRSAELVQYLLQGIPLNATPRDRKVCREERCMKDGSVKPCTSIADDTRLDRNSGFILPRTLISEGVPLAARQLNNRSRKGPTAEQKLLQRIFLEGGKVPTLTKQDASWYCPLGINGIVEKVSYSETDPSASGLLSIEYFWHQWPENGDHIATSFGLEIPISPLIEMYELPYTADGRAVDALCVVPKKLWDVLKPQADCSILFDPITGEYVESALILEKQSLAISIKGEPFAFDGSQTTNVFNHSIRQKDIPAFATYALLPQLEGLGASEAIRQYLFWRKSRKRTPRRVIDRLKQLLSVFGLHVVYDERKGISCEPISINSTFGPELPKPSETYYVRESRNMPIRGGLFHAPSFVQIVDKDGVADSTTNSENPIDVQPLSQDFDHSGFPPNRQRVQTATMGGQVVATTPFPEPMVNPLSEEAIASFLKLNPTEFVDLLLGERGISISETGEIRFICLSENRGDLRDFDGSQVISGASAVRVLLEHRMTEEPRAKILLNGIWDSLPILPPNWRPLIQGSGASDLSSDLNRLYLDVIFAINSLQRLKNTHTTSGPALLLSRGILREKLHQLYGLLDKDRDERSRRHYFYSMQLPSKYSSLMDRLRREIQQQSSPSSQEPLPFSIIAPWHVDNGLRNVLVPQRLLLRIWNKEVTAALYRNPRVHSISRAARMVELAGAEAQEQLLDLIRAINSSIESIQSEDDMLCLSGYLLTREGVCIPVRMMPYIGNSIGMPKVLAKRLKLSQENPILLFIPPHQSAQREATNLASAERQEGLWGLCPELYLVTMKRWGHLRIGIKDCTEGVASSRPKTATTREFEVQAIEDETSALDPQAAPRVNQQSSHEIRQRPNRCNASVGVCAACLESIDPTGAPALVGMTLAAWLIRQLMQFPMLKQRELAIHLRKNRLKNEHVLRDIVQTRALETPISEKEQRLLDVLIFLSSNRHAPMHTHLYQLDSERVLRQLVTEGGTLGVDDFLSRQILKVWSPALSDLGKSTAFGGTEVRHERILSEPASLITGSPYSDNEVSRSEAAADVHANGDSGVEQSREEDTSAPSNIGGGLQPPERTSHIAEFQGCSFTGGVHLTDECVIVDDLTSALAQLLSPKSIGSDTHSLNESSLYEALNTEKTVLDTIDVQPLRGELDNISHKEVAVTPIPKSEPIPISELIQRYDFGLADWAHISSTNDDDGDSESIDIYRHPWASFRKEALTVEPAISAVPTSQKHGNERTKPSQLLKRQHQQWPVSITPKMLNTDPEPADNLTRALRQKEMVSESTEASKHSNVLARHEQAETQNSTHPVPPSTDMDSPCRSPSEGRIEESVFEISTHPEVASLEPISLEHHTMPNILSRDSSELPFAPARLIIIRNGTIGRTFQFQAPLMTLGRFNIDEASFPDIDLEEEDTYQRIDPIHCSFKWKDERWFLEDQGSIHGTSHNRSKRLEHHKQIPLNSGDEIIVGKLYLRFELSKGNA